MKLKIKKELLQKAVLAVEKNVGRNLSLPVLNNILIKTEKNKLILISTDLEIAIIVKLFAKIEEEGVIVLDPKTLSGLLNNLPDGEVVLKTKQNTLYVEQKNYKSSIKGYDDKEFPLLPKTDKSAFFTVSSNTISQGLNQVVNSTAKSDLKPELTGVYFDVKKSEIKLVSTDSFRLAEKTINRDKAESVNSDNFILPTKATQEIIRNYQDLNDVLFFYITKNQVAVVNEGNEKFKVEVISKTIEGEYPDYKQIIPKDHKTRAIVSKKDLVQQIKAGSLFSSRINDIEFKIEKDKISVMSQNNDVGEFASSVEASVEGDEQSVKLNYNYVLDGLGNVDGEEVVFKISKSDGPIIIESVKQKNYFYILMPIRK